METEVEQELLFVWNSGRHEVTVFERAASVHPGWAGSRPAAFVVGVDCIDADGYHVRGTVISEYATREDAVRNARHLTEILAWRSHDGFVRALGGGS